MTEEIAPLLCINCKHYRLANYNEWCMHPLLIKKISPVHGREITSDLLCERSREQHRFCGPEGYYWEVKP